MNCEEIGELMQRQLDNDLVEHELTTLTAHLESCDECSGVFERLMMLSNSLEQLPQVTPPINIVDSILLDLATIDQQRELEKQHFVDQSKRNKKIRALTTSVSSVAAAAFVVIATSLIWNATNVDQNEKTSVALNSEIHNATTMLQDKDVSVTRTTADYENENMAELKRKEVADSPSTLDIMNRNDLIIEPLSSPSSEMSRSNEMHESSEMMFTMTPESNRSKEDVDEQGHDISTSETGQYLLQYSPEITVTDQSGYGLDDEESSRSTLHNFDMLANTKNYYYSTDETFYIVIKENILTMYETSSDQVVKEWPILISDSETVLFGYWEVDNSAFTYHVANEAGEITDVIVKVE